MVWQSQFGSVNVVAEEDSFQVELVLGDEEASQFPLLIAAIWLPGGRMEDAVQSTNIERLVCETGMALQRCLKPQSFEAPVGKNSGLSLGERLMQSIVIVDMMLSERNDLQYRSLISTSENLEALCAMCDQGFESVQFEAITMLYSLVSTMESISNTKMSDDSTFAFFLMCAMAKSISRMSKEDGEHCLDKAFVNLSIALEHCNQAPRTVVSVLADYDWKSILNVDKAMLEGRQICFHILHRWAERALQTYKKDASAIKLLGSLGLCDELVLQQSVPDSPPFPGGIESVLSITSM